MDGIPSVARLLGPWEPLRVVADRALSFFPSFFIRTLLDINSFCSTPIDRSSVLAWVQIMKPPVIDHVHYIHTTLLSTNLTGSKLPFCSYNIHYSPS